MTLRNKVFLLFLIILVMSVAWFFFDKRKGYIELPVKFGELSKPFIDVAIESNSYPLYLDLGYISQLSLNKEILCSIDKNFYKTVEFMDLKGKEYTSPAYFIPQVKIGNLSFADVVAKKVNLDFNENTSIPVPIKDSNPLGLSTKIGSIGLYLMNRTNLGLDFPNSRILLANNLEEVYPTYEKWIKVPFELDSWIILSIETDLGIKKFALDTGASLTFIRSSSLAEVEWEKGDLELPFLQSSRFIMGGKDFGSCKLYAFDISPSFPEFDGILGMDFLKDQTIYIDFTHNVLLIKPE